MARIVSRNGKYKVIIELGRDDRTGKRERHTKEGFKTKREATAYATVKENELLNGLIIGDSKEILEDFILEWYDRQIENNHAGNTVSNYTARINKHIIPYMGKMKLSKIKVTHVQKFYYHLLDNGLNADSAKRVIQVLRSCLEYAKKLKIINEVPCDIEFNKNITTKKLSVFTEDQLIYFLSQIKKYPVYLPTFLAAFTGLRIGEICGLRWDNVDLNNNRIKVCEQTLNDKINKVLVHTELLKTSSSYRTITIPQFLSDYLSTIKPDESLLIKGVNDFVILDKHGRMSNPRNVSMDFTHKISKYNANKEKLPESYIPLPQITFHDLRHTHATLLLLHGENIKVISERLGHKDISVTLNTYSHVLPSMEEHTALLLDTVFGTKI